MAAEFVVMRIFPALRYVAEYAAGGLAVDELEAGEEAFMFVGRARGARAAAL